MTKPDVSTVSRPSKMEQGTTRYSGRGIEWLMVSHNEKAITSDYNILKVAFHINNLVAFLEGQG